MALKSFSFKTKDGFEHWVNRWIPEPETEIKAVIVFHHGLAEHSLRYDRFGSILSENGYVFDAYDLRGHGRTAELSIQNKTGCFGKIANNKGSKIVISDLDEIIDAAKAEYPDKPLILMGHSFGSFVVQKYIENYSQKIDACFLLGTAGPRLPLVTGGKILTGLLKTFTGPDSHIKFLEKIAFGSYNSHIQNKKTDKDWLSKDELAVEMNLADQWCKINLSTAFYYDMMSILREIHLSKNMKKISVDLPLYILYGSEDPVGDYGKTVKNLYDIYKKNGIKSLTIKEYENDRHELLNETDKDKVENDILEYLAQIVNK